MEKMALGGYSCTYVWKFLIYYYILLPLASDSNDT